MRELAVEAFVEPVKRHGIAHLRPPRVCARWIGLASTKPLVRNRTDSENVAAPVIDATIPFRRHIRWRPWGERMSECGVRGLGDAEVQQFECVGFVDDEIRGFDIPMNDAMLVHM